MNVAVTVTVTIISISIPIINISNTSLQLVSSYKQGLLVHPFFLIVLFVCSLLFVAAPCFKFKLIPEFQSIQTLVTQGQSSCHSVVFPSQRARFHDAFKKQHGLYSHACNYLKANTAFIVSRIWSALMFSLKPFIQANITHVTMERSVLVNTKNKRKRHHRLNIDLVKIL